MGVNNKSLDEMAIKFSCGVFKMLNCEEFEVVPVIGSFLNFYYGDLHLWNFYQS